LKPNNRRNLGLTIAAVLILAGIAWVSLRSTNEPQPTEQSVENPKAAGVLSPALFTDEKARAAYQTAKDIPEVLEQLPCFCGCMMNMGHKNNLFCFMDQHGSVCDICEDIALDARAMHDKGLPVDQIRENIRGKYARFQPGN
jgi:Protein of unknown function with PCYCGC motif